MAAYHLPACHCRPHAFCTVGALVLIGLVMAPGMQGWALDDAPTRATLKGLSGVGVWVEDLAPDIVQRGVTTQQLQTEVERQVRRAGITVFSSQEASAPLDRAVVAISVTTLQHPGGLYAYAVDLAVYQAAALVRDPTPRSVATWAVGSLGLVEAANLRAISTHGEPAGRPFYPGLSSGESSRQPGGRAVRRGPRSRAPGARAPPGRGLCAWRVRWAPRAAHACGAPAVSTAPWVASHGCPSTPQTLKALGIR